MSGLPIIQLEQIGLTLREKTILHDISFSVRQGEFLAILGPSGAGKTSLLRLLNSLQQPTGGEIYFKKQKLSQMDIRLLRKYVGMLFQRPAIFEGKVRDNLLVAGRWDSEIASLDDQVLQEKLNHVGLPSDLLSNNARDLSGGEQQRLALARTLLNRPEILLLDEPTASLDPKLARSIMRKIKELQHSLGLTVIAVSHDHRLLNGFADRALVLFDGQVRSLQPYDELVKTDDPELRDFLAAGESE